MARHAHSREHDDARVELEPGSMHARSTLMRARGLRVTASRLAVLDLVETSEEPLTHHEVCDKLVDTPWNRSTLYRNLVDMTDVGILVKTEIGGVMRFQRAGHENACAEHPHFVCTDCGNVSCLPKSSVTLHAGATNGGAVEVQLRGRCGGCVTG
jgi:Fur family ferric uptake transcriptional regulator